jgi:hypothetical protein
MMPISFNATIMNPKSLHAVFVSSLVETTPAEARDCVKVVLKHPKIVWPYFTTVSLEISINDSCRSLGVPSVEVVATFLLR